MGKKIFGYALMLDLQGCDLGVMRSKAKLKRYVDELCKVIDMKKYGSTLIKYFGLQKPHTKGYSLMQFIETSSVTGHFSEHWRISYIDIFSCKPFDHNVAKSFTKKYFGAKSVKSRFVVR
jgi:S-adenosylmethionine/arginine decarboxylase-like enzyme